MAHAGTPNRVQIITVSATAFLLSTLGACGTATTDSLLPPVKADAAPDAHYLGALSVRLNQETEVLDARYERWAGTVSLEQASVAIQAYYDNAPMAACVAERGLSFDWEGAIQPVREPSVHHGHEELAPPTLKRSDLARTNAQASRLVSQLSVVPPEPLNKATAECSYELHEYGPGLLDGYSEEDLHELLAPKVRDELASQWDVEVDKVADELNVSDDSLSACLAESTLAPEFSELDGVVPLDAYVEVVEEAIDKVASVPARGKRETPAWRDAVAVERSLELASWECKKDYYRDGLNGLSAAMDRFEIRNAGKIREAAALNQEIIDVATELGWSPRKPVGSAGHEEPSR